MPVVRWVCLSPQLPFPHHSYLFSNTDKDKSLFVSHFPYWFSVWQRYYSVCKPREAKKVSSRFETAMICPFFYLWTVELSALWAFYKAPMSILVQVFPCTYVFFLLSNYPGVISELGECLLETPDIFHMHLPVQTLTEVMEADGELWFPHIPTLVSFLLLRQKCPTPRLRKERVILIYGV